jgi:hypothetical protein
MATTVNLSSVRLLTFVTLVLFVLAFISFVVPTVIVGVSGLAWAAAAFVSWTLERLL